MLYLCAIKDLWANKIVGYSIDSRMKARLAVNALEMVVAHRGSPEGVIVHSDCGIARRIQLVATLNRL